MSNMSRKIKMSALVSKVNEVHMSEVGIGGLEYREKRNTAYSFHYCPSGILRLIFDYDQLSDETQIIVDEAVFQMPFQRSYGGCLHADDVIEGFKDDDEKMKIAKEWIDWCLSRGIYSECRKKEEEAFYFLFWALMIVDIDGEYMNDKQMEVADYCEIFDLSEKEIMEIKEIVKIVRNTSDLKIMHLPDSFTEECMEKRREVCETLGAKFETDRILTLFSPLFYEYFGISGEDILNEKKQMDGTLTGIRSLLSMR